MSSIKGKRLICDRCGKEVFLKLTGEMELDGGYTRINQFEEKPEGWGYNSAIDMDICPECNKELQKILENYKNNLNEFKKGEQ